MQKGKIELTQKDAENTPAGGVVVGKRDGQTMIYDDASLGGYFVGKLHSEGGIKMINKSTGQPLEVQGSEVIITAPAVYDKTKRNFEGQMMTNREILSKINSDGGGVSFADGGDIPAKIHTTDKEYEYGGKMVHDSDIAQSLGMNSILKKGKQHFSSGGKTYDVDAIYNAIKKGKLRLKTKEVETFPMKYPVYDKKYSETVKTDFRKPNGITVRTESGEEVLIDGNHRMNNAYLKGRKTMKTYYIQDPKQIAKFAKKNKFELGGENKVGGHLSSGKSLKQIAEMHNVSLAHINEQLAKGLEVEKEHFADFKERTRVAKDHLVENPNYYTILEKAGLKNGGHLKPHHKKGEDLVKDAKDGNTPARDLNNYNDLLDVQADGQVGGDSGIEMDGALVTGDAGAVDDFANGGQLDDWFEKPHNLKGIYYKSPFAVEVTDLDCAKNIKNKHNQVEVIKLVNPRVKIPVSYVLVIKNWSSVDELKDMLTECSSNMSSYGFTSNEQIDAYKRMSFANGGLTPYDANQEGDSFPVLSTGGGVGLPKVAYVKASNAGSSLYNLVGNKYNSYIEFAESVEDAYKKLGKTVRSFVELEAFDSNDEKLISVSSYVSNQKNTVKNFNPFTGNYKNLEKSLQNSRPRSFQKFDWEDWLLSRVKPSTFSSSTTIQTPTPTTTKDNSVNKISITYDSRVGTKNGMSLKNNGLDFYEFLNGLKIGSFENVKIQPIGKDLDVNSLTLDLNTSFWENTLTKMPQKSALIGIKNFLYTYYPDLDFYDFLKETSSVSSQTTNQKTVSTSALPFDFTDTKIDVSNDTELSLKVQKRAFELGWEWEITGKTLDYNSFNYMYFTKKSISFGNTSSSFINSPKRKITESEIFGNASLSNNENIVDVVRLEYQLDDKNYYERSFKIGEKLLEDFAKIEFSCMKNPDAIISVTIFAEVVDSNGKITTKRQRISIGENAFKPSQFTYDEIKKLFEEEWFDNQLDFNNFFNNKGIASKELLTDLSNTKIWIGDNPELSKKVQERAFELGWSWSGGKVAKYTKEDSLFFFLNKSIGFGEGKQFYDGEKDLTEIFADDLFKDASQLNVSKKERVRFLTATSYGATKNVRNLFEIKDFIEQNYASNGGSDGTVGLYLNGDMMGGSWRITYGDGKKCSTCYDLLEEGTNRIKEILLSYAGADEFDWSDFFEESQTPTSNSVVPKTVETTVSDLDEAIKKLEKASSSVVTQYNKDIYDQSLKFLYDTKATYELALKFTPESAFIYERLDIMKKLADIEKKIKNIEDMKKGGTFYMLAQILEKLERGENWKLLEQSQDVITNQIPQSEIDIIIRSKKFKNWFGNWEKALINNEYDNVSKALTNGLPSVYHHGARRIKYTYREVYNGVLYLAENVSYAVWFSQNATAQSEEGNYLTECFVNIKNPIDLTAFHVNRVDLGDIVKYVDAIYPLAKIYDFIPAQVALLIKTNQPTNVMMWAWQLIRSYAKFVNHIKENTPYDGFLYYENNPSDQVVNSTTGQTEENVTKAVAIFKSHQVKVVDAVLFDGGLDDWRFENGGKIKN